MNHDVFRETSIFYCTYYVHYEFKYEVIIIMHATSNINKWVVKVYTTCIKYWYEMLGHDAKFLNKYAWKVEMKVHKL